MGASVIGSKKESWYRVKNYSRPARECSEMLSNYIIRKPL